ncbi:hypothetical protein KDA82_34615, partial [Streptomyces daliensis]|nr:hypothetical protein [Streptomyces daliensis]
MRRTRALLAERQLPVRTGAREGFSAPVQKAGATGTAGASKPVVRAVWPRDAATSAPDPSAPSTTAPHSP